MPLIAMVLLFIVVTVFSLAVVVREFDIGVAKRVDGAVAATIDSNIHQMAIMAEDNAVWDDAVAVVYSDKPSKKFLWSAWGVVTAEAKNYDTAIVIDAAGAPVLAYRRGKEARIDPQEFGPAFEALQLRLKTTGQPVGGLLSTSRGPALAGMASLLPTDRALDGMVPEAGPFTLVFMRPFDAQSAQAAGDALSLKDMMIGHASAGRGSSVIRDAAGKPVLTLSWVAESPGAAAVWRALPWILAASLFHVTVGIFISNYGRRSIRELANQALIDSLSKLPNRRALRGRLTERLARGEKLALVMIDLDGFKGINDIYGHGVGDRLLKAIAGMLTRVAGEGTMVARLGGDEFAILVCGNDAAERGEDIARQVLAELAHPFRIDERTVLVGASIGLASAGVGNFDASELMRQADVAMYTAKSAGKMRLTWFDEMLDQKQVVARTIERELRDAIVNDTFEIAYQPVFDAVSQKIVGAEALLRWESPTRGPVKTKDFIGIAEETGLIDSIGKIVLSRACRDALAWPDLFLAVNLSSSQLRNPSFAEDLSEILAETAFPADRLELELTEKFLVFDAEMAMRVLVDIRKLGVRLALDDFGSGFSAVAHLRQFPFSKIKIDRTLVNAACNSETARVILQAGITVARVLKLSIAAEGVETGEHRDMMRVAGCDLLQGWLYAKAGPADHIAARIAHDYPKAEAAVG